MITIPNSVAQELAKHAIAWYNSESCGLLFAQTGSDACVRCVCMENLQDKYHEIGRAAESTGQRLAAIFHSHVDCGAYFSEEDVLMAAPFGEPNDPDMWHVVVDCQANGVHGAKAYKWDGATFAEHIIEDFPRVIAEGAGNE